MTLNFKHFTHNKQIEKRLPTLFALST